MLDWALNSGTCSEFPAWRWLRVAWCGCWELSVPNSAVGRRTLSALQLQLHFHALATDHKCKFGTYFCHQSPQSIFHLGGSAVGSVIYSCSNGKEKLAVCSFQRKKAQFQVHPRFPFHPTRGGSLKVIFSASSGLGFALSRTREMQAFI